MGWKDRREEGRVKKTVIYIYIYMYMYMYILTLLKTPK